MKKLYLFSGLGADKRAFQQLDLSAYDTTFIEWVPPEKNETIEAYAKKDQQSNTCPKLCFNWSIFWRNNGC
ncbi:hypothetical protein RCC89_14360 [Cytophagaceae bacterium ABcell3]|nr:hypothetical protein RCC89_14360 [Cytophagaceae bacterium ABcell3]